MTNTELSSLISLNANGLEEMSRRNSYLLAKSVHLSKIEREIGTKVREDRARTRAASEPRGYSISTAKKFSIARARSRERALKAVQGEDAAEE